jgi:hypothetical protein
MHAGYIVGDTIHEIRGNFLEQWEETGKTYPLASVKIEVPIIPKTFYAAGFNYADSRRRGSQSNG